MNQHKNAFSFKWFFIFLISLVAFFPNPIYSQSNGSTQNLSQVRVDELSDAQVKAFWGQYQSKGFTLNDLEVEVSNRKMSQEEIQKLKSRIQKLNLESGPKQDNETDSKGLNRVSEKNDNQGGIEEPFQNLKTKIFGQELFNNKKLSFEPNLKMATPLNYQIGPDDELNIDIFGFSEQSYKIKVSPEGSVRIPNLGPVQVSGLTIEQAQNKIRSSLIKIYPRIGSGETSVSVTLGNMRSIKVVILGEANLPGTYTLPSLATVFNALYVSGGPNDNGSFRNIKVVRNSKIIVKIDMYDFLLNGNTKGNIRLQDQDVIKVEPFDNRVEVKGFVKRDGFFEILPKESLKQLIDFAGGFNPNAYTSRIKVTRNTGKQKSVSDIEQLNYSSFFPKNGDAFLIDSILNRYENRIEIKGAVFRPGYFGLEENPSLLKLIKNAEGLREDAFLTRATILRKKPDNNLEMLSVNLQELMNGAVSDINLKREDIVQIASKIELKETIDVSINGEVLKPGVYPFAENMKIEDLIILAGGLKESASVSKIEVAQRSYTTDKNNPNSEIAIINTFTVNKDLKNDPNIKYVLSPFDVVTVFAQPGYVAQKVVNLTGEVMFPGKYVLGKNNERISDLLKRAGGLTALGFAEGAILIRPKENSITEQIVSENKLKALKKQSKDTSSLSDEIENEISRTADVVGINLEKIIKKPGSKEDLFLRNNDILQIPYLKQTVLVSGQVLYPVRVRFDPSNSFRDYISYAGGYSPKAMRRRAYIVYANGTAKASRSWVFFRTYPKVKPGSEVVVPMRESKKPISTLEIVTIATSLTSMLFILSTVIKL